jgi:DNA-binding response OmpR family regulator
MRGILSKKQKITLSSQRKRILVVDDDESVLSSVCEVLERSGFEVDRAESGKEAIDKSNWETYDAALIDLKLPDMDGIDVLSKANLREAVKIMLTGFPSFASSMKAGELGVDAYLAKPVRPTELVLVIESKIKSRERTRP